MQFWKYFRWECSCLKHKSADYFLKMAPILGLQLTIIFIVQSTNLSIIFN